MDVTVIKPLQTLQRGTLRGLRRRKHQTLAPGGWGAHQRNDFHEPDSCIFLYTEKCTIPYLEMSGFLNSNPLMFYLVFVAKTPVCPGSSLTSLGQFFRVAVPNHFGPSDWLCGRQFFHGPGLGEWFGDDSSALYLLCVWACYVDSVVSNSLQPHGL